MEIYVNGVLSASTTGTFSAPTDTTDPLVIGWDNVNAARYFTGNIDDIRIYNRVLLPSEVKTLSLSRGIAYRPRQKRIMPHYVTFPAETFTGPYIHVKRTKLLAGKYAVRKEDAKFPQLFEGRVGAWCPSITGPTGLKLFDFARNNTGTLTNMAASSSWARSQGRYCVDLDGTDDAINLGDPQHLDFSSQSFSISAWVCVDVLPTVSAGGAIISKWNTAARQFIINIRHTGATNPSTVEFETGNGSSDGGCRSTQTVTAGTWIHLVGVYDHRATTCTLYWNGVQEATNSTVAPAATSRVLYIGRRDDATANYLNAKLDDIAIYNRVLTAFEIRILSRSRGIAYTPKQKQYQPHNFAAVAATISRLLMLRRKRALQCY